MQRLRGDGMAFLHADSTVIKREIKHKIIRVDTGCIAAFSPIIEYDTERAGGLKSMAIGGESMFLAKLKGSGTVYLQSLPFSRLANRVLQAAAVGDSKGEGSFLDDLGGMFENR